jgi:hypothetical protein
MIRALVLFAAVAAALWLQEFLPLLAFFDGARVLLVPVIFCYGALWLPFSAMLLLALYTGLLVDLATLNIIDGRVEIGLGWSMLFYVFVGSLLNNLRRAFPDGRWEVHCLASGLVTLLYLLGQYLMISLRRESFYFDSTVFWHLAGPSLAALLLAPPLFFLLQLVPGGFLSRADSPRHLRS